MSNRSHSSIIIHTVVGGLDLTGGFWFVDIYKNTPEYAAVTAVCYSSASGPLLFKTRSKYNNTWTAWYNVAYREDAAARTIPSRIINIAASELADYISNLPRILTERLYIRVDSGIVDQTLKIERFSGPGYIRINPKDNGNVQLTSGIYIYDCDLNMFLVDLNISGMAVFEGAQNESLHLENSTRVALRGCEFTGNNELIAVVANYNCGLSMESCVIKNYGTAVISERASVCSAFNCTCENNVQGAYVYAGGIVLLSGTTPDLMGGTTNKKSGGIIAKANGTLL